MNRKYLGDSYDLVKRFFCSILTALGYEVVIDPMFTGEWGNGEQEAFYLLIGASPATTPIPNSRRTALLIDLDTGIRERGGRQHVSFDRIATEVNIHALVFVFDQSFSYQEDRHAIMREKLTAMTNRGCHCFYYDSHARFLFASLEVDALNVLLSRLREIGMPGSRLFQIGT